MLMDTLTKSREMFYVDLLDYWASYLAVCFLS